MKKVLQIASTLVVGMLIAGGGVAAANQSVKVTIDGASQAFEQSAVIVDGTTLVPMRTIFEKLGAQIKWDQETSTVTASKGATFISLTIGKSTATVNNGTVTLSAKPRLVSGVTMVPLRFVSEALGGKVEWNDSTMTASITSEERLKRLIDYNDKSKYSDKTKYNEDQIGVNEMLGFDLSAALNDTILNYYNELAKKQAAADEKKLQNEKEQSERFQGIVNDLVTASQDGDDAFKKLWDTISASDKKSIALSYLDYEKALKIWPNMTFVEKAALWPSLSYIYKYKLFVQLPDKDKRIVWVYGTDNLAKRGIWFQIRFLDQSKPIELWRWLDDFRKYELYNALSTDDKEWLIAHLNSDEKARLDKLLKNPPRSADNESYISPKDEGFDAKWRNLNDSEKTSTWKQLEYEDKVLLWNKVSLVERIYFWRLIDKSDQPKFFGQLSDTSKMDVWNLAMTSEASVRLWRELRWIDEVKPIELWRMLDSGHKLNLYTSMNEEDKIWLNYKLTSKEITELRELLRNPPQPPIDENGAVG